jgi:hypothetical protein
MKNWRNKWQKKKNRVDHSRWVYSYRGPWLVVKRSRI